MCVRLLVCLSLAKESCHKKRGAQAKPDVLQRKKLGRRTRFLCALPNGVRPSGIHRASKRCGVWLECRLVRDGAIARQEAARKRRRVRSARYAIECGFPLVVCGV